MSRWKFLEWEYLQVKNNAILMDQTSNQNRPNNLLGAGR